MTTLTQRFAVLTLLTMFAAGARAEKAPEDLSAMLQCYKQMQNERMIGEELHFRFESLQKVDKGGRSVPVFDRFAPVIHDEKRLISAEAAFAYLPQFDNGQLRGFWVYGINESPRYYQLNKGLSLKELENSPPFLMNFPKDGSTLIQPLVSGSRLTLDFRVATAEQQKDFGTNRNMSSVLLSIPNSFELAAGTKPNKDVLPRSLTHVEGKSLEDARTALSNEVTRLLRRSYRDWYRELAASKSLNLLSSSDVRQSRTLQDMHKSEGQRKALLNTLTSCQSAKAGNAEVLEKFVAAVKGADDSLSLNDYLTKYFGTEMLQREQERFLSESASPSSRHRR